MTYSNTSIELYAVRKVQYTDDNIQIPTSSEDVFSSMGRGDQLASMTFFNKRSRSYKKVSFTHMHREISMNPLKRYIPLHAPINIVSNTMNPTTVAGSIVDNGNRDVYIIGNIGSNVFLRYNKDTVELTTRQFNNLGGTSDKSVFFGYDDIKSRVVQDGGN